MATRRHGGGGGGAMVAAVTVARRQRQRQMTECVLFACANKMQIMPRTRWGCVSRDDGQIAKTLIINENWLPRNSPVCNLHAPSETGGASLVRCCVHAFSCVTHFVWRAPDTRLRKGFSRTKCQSDGFAQQLYHERRQRRKKQIINAPDSRQNGW